MVSKRFVNELSSELPALVKEHILTDAQAKKITNRYKDVEGTSLTSIISIFGAILIGVGILTLVALNWEKIPDFVRVLFLLAVTFGTCYGGYVLRFKKTFPKVGSAVLFLSSILFGVTIILISQIYNLHSDSGHWLLLWCLGIIPLAYAVSSVSSLSLGLVIFSYWFGTQYSRLAGGHEALSGIFEYWPITVGVFLCYGILLWGIGQLHEKKNLGLFSATYQYVGLFFILLNTYMLTFKFFTDNYWNYNQYAAINMNVFIALWVLWLLSILLLAFLLFRNHNKTELWTALALTVISLIGLLVIVNPGVRQAYDIPTDLFTPYSLVMNVLFIALLIGLAALGMHTQRPVLVNFAVFFFGLDVITRYFEFFYDRLSGGLFFIITGLILIFAAVAMEKLRRKLITEMD